MSKFNYYAVKANEIAKTALNELAAAESASRDAEVKAKAHPVRTAGHIEADEQLIALTAKTDMVKAQEKLKATRAAMGDTSRQLQAIRQELSEALADEYSAKPAHLDMATVELLKSGILKPDEYARLMADAKEHGNSTMMRLIGRYSATAAEQYDLNDKRGQMLRAVAAVADDDIVSSKLGLFDIIVEVYNRTANNIYMFDSWDELTHRAVENI